LEQAIEGQLILSQIAQLEKYLLDRNFVSDIAKLKGVNPIPQNISAPEKLKEKANGTACIICREQALAAVTNFYDGLNQYYKVVAFQKHDSLGLVVENKLYSYIERVELIEKNVRQQYGDSLPASVSFLYNKLLETKRDMGNLNELVKINLMDKSLVVISELNSKILGYMGSIEENFRYILDKRPDFFKTVPLAAPKKEEVAESVATKSADDTSLKPSVPGGEAVEMQRVKSE